MRLQYMHPYINYSYYFVLAVMAECINNTPTHSACTKISPSLARRFSNCPRGKGFVKMSATISCVGQYLRLIVLS